MLQRGRRDDERLNRGTNQAAKLRKLPLELFDVALQYCGPCLKLGGVQFKDTGAWRAT
jgi:hypothetical protein